jgi:hypothetical protein
MGRDSSGRASQTLFEQRVPVRDYAQLARDWNYAATTICAESAFIFSCMHGVQIYFR